MINPSAPPSGSQNPQAIMDQAQKQVSMIAAASKQPPQGLKPPQAGAPGAGMRPPGGMMPGGAPGGMPPGGAPGGGMPPAGMMPPGPPGLASQTPLGAVAPNAGAMPPGPPPTALAEGGIPDSNEMAPWYVKNAARETVHNSGLTKSVVPGRTDQLNHLVPAGAYVIPADVVSGLGEGNTMAGANIMQHIFSGPKGMPLPSARGEMGAPRAPAPYREPGPNQSYAKGGRATGHVPVILAGGEYVVHPEDVKRIPGANGDISRGHGILDKFVVHARKKIAHEMLRLKGPKK